MNNVDKGQKALNIIKKEGDLYDVISKAKNVKTTINPFGRVHILLFSRILYAGVLVKDKIESYFSPVEKVHNAQEDIRTLLGLNVDVINDKITSKISDLVFRKKTISLLYEDNNVYMDEYIANLQKLLSFCLLYKIEHIFLSIGDLDRLFYELDLSSFNSCSKSGILNKLNSIYTEDHDLLMLNSEALQKLINMLLNYKIDKAFIMKIGYQIKDPVIEIALNDYYNFGYLDNLKRVLLTRLCSNINSNSSYKTRSGAKGFDTVNIFGEFIKVTSTIQGCDMPEVSVMRLCEYLGYPSYDVMFNSINHLYDDKNCVLMAILHLYINNAEKINVTKGNNSQSFYDQIYESYLASKENKAQKRIKGLPSKVNKVTINFISMFAALYITSFSFALGFGSLACIDVANIYFLKKDDSNILTTFLEYIVKPYTYSWKLESDLINDVIGELEGDRIELSNGITTPIKEGFFSLNLGNNEDKVVAKVNALSGMLTSDLPNYYAVEYGLSSTYKKGDIKYDLKERNIAFSSFENLESLFQVEVFFSRSEIRDLIKNNTITIPMTLYPLGDSYILTKVIISDKKDKSKSVAIDAGRAIIFGSEISDEEAKLLRSMKKPSIQYYYGINPYYLNTFMCGIKKEGTYLETSESEMRKVITDALGIDSNASYSEIYSAIKGKKYSLKPFEDSGVTASTKKMDEKEFIGTVASMDYLICNLAATLAVEANSDLTYIVGFHTNSTVITLDQAHAWAVNPSGIIIDVTPSNKDEKSEEENVIANVLEFASQSNLPFALVLLLISKIIYSTLGKKIIFTVKVHNVKNLLENEKMTEAYAYINETQYGGINIPKYHTPSEFIDIISDDFEGYTKEELTYLLSRLKKKQNPETPIALKVIKSVPFIKDNKDVLTRKLTKKKSK